MNRFVKSINRVSLIQQIIIGLIIGILTALYVPDVANELALLGVLFVGALKRDCTNPRILPCNCSHQ